MASSAAPTPCGRPPSSSGGGRRKGWTAYPRLRHSRLLLIPIRRHAQNLTVSLSLSCVPPHAISHGTLAPRRLKRVGGGKHPTAARTTAAGAGLRARGHDARVPVRHAGRERRHVRGPPAAARRRARPAALDHAPQMCLTVQVAIETARIQRELSIDELSLATGTDRRSCARTSRPLRARATSLRRRRTWRRSSCREDAPAHVHLLPRLETPRPIAMSLSSLLVYACAMRRRGAPRGPLHHVGGARVRRTRGRLLLGLRGVAGQRDDQRVLRTLGRLLLLLLGRPAPDAGRPGVRASARAASPVGRPRPLARRAGDVHQTARPAAARREAARPASERAAGPASSAPAVQPFGADA